MGMPQPQALGTSPPPEAEARCSELAEHMILAATLRNSSGNRYHLKPGSSFLIGTAHARKYFLIRC